MTDTFRQVPAHEVVPGDVLQDQPGTPVIFVSTHPKSVPEPLGGMTSLYVAGGEHFDHSPEQLVSVLEDGRSEEERALLRLPAWGREHLSIASPE